MQENQKKLNELQRRRLTGQFQNAALNCAKCGLPLEGETVELKSANKEYHKKYSSILRLSLLNLKKKN